MRLLLAAVAAVACDTALQAAAHPGLPVPAVIGYALTVALLVCARHRTPTAAFGATLALAALTDGAYVLLLWMSYRTGTTRLSRRDTAVVSGVAVGGLALRIATSAGPLAQTVAGYTVFAVLPLVVGRYLAQHRRLVSALDRQNHSLRRERSLLAEQEQLRERLRIARDVHDSLGRWLSLVAVRAAALEVSDLPPSQRAAVRSLGDTARGAMTELYELVGSLRGAHDELPRGVAAIGAVVAESTAAGQHVTLHTSGEPQPLPAAVDSAAYRLVAEGLTNAAKHAPGRPVTVRLCWEADALVLNVTNPVADGTGAGAGYGLAGLRERVGPAGGFVDHRVVDGEFRLSAMLPVPAPGQPERQISPARATALGVASAVLLFLLLPASLLAGVS